MRILTSKKHRLGSAVLSSVAVLALASGSVTPAVAADAPLVYFMIPNTTPTRYIQQDAPDFASSLKKLDPTAKVVFVNAGGSSATQLSQAQTAIAAGAKALVVVAADPSTSAGLLQAAAAAKVPVIGYENPPINGPVTAQVQFDPLNAGQVQGKYFAQQVAKGSFGKTPVRISRLYGNKGDVYTTQMLKGQNQYISPLIKSGKIKVVCQDYVKNWDPAEAQKNMDQCLTKTQGKVRAVLGFYDGITAGAIASIKARKLSGKIAVYGGQNPELSGLQYMLTGDQQDEVIKAFPAEASIAAQLVFALINGKPLPTKLITTSVNNGAVNVPTAIVPVEYIHTAKGVDVGTLVQKAVDYGMFTWKDICTGVAAKTATCKAKNH
jgi:D-xylose transport system substrate-binding protein